MSVLKQKDGSNIYRFNCVEYGKTAGLVVWSVGEGMSVSKAVLSRQ